METIHQQIDPIDEVRTLTLDEAQMAVEEIRHRFATYSVNLIACGSYRREERIVHDLDFVVIPKILDVFLHNLRAFADQIISAGDKKVSLIHNHVQFDFLITNKFSIGASILHFTGDKEFNIYCRRVAKSRNWKLNEWGLWQGEKSIGGASELGILETLRLTAFKDPKSRCLGSR
jgi:DNA polymerase (family 10)